LNSTLVKIDDAVIELIDCGEGTGHIKVNASDAGLGHFSYYWGAMGTSIVPFVASINEGYFLNKLNPYDRGVFCARATLKQVRNFVKESLRWHECLKEQKRLRQELKKLEDIDDEDRMVRALGRLSVEDSDNYRFKEVISAIQSEPWSFLDRTNSKYNIFLGKLFKKLKTRLKVFKNV